MTIHVYTSYYGAMAKLLREFKPQELVNIARSPPISFTGMVGVRSYKILAPPWDLLNDWHKGRMKPSEYVTRFENQVLEGLKPREVLKDLIQHNEKVVLLCYEPPGCFCHRHLVAEWIKDTTMVDVTEYKI